jgi:xanthine dehydrogenase accessory factor
MLLTIIRGGGDLASGIAMRLYRSGIKVVIVEISRPLAVRRFVSFAEAVYAQSVKIEEIDGILFKTVDELSPVIWDKCIPVVVDEDLSKILALNPQVIIDARMQKIKPEYALTGNPLIIGIGPGFFVGKNCDCVIETKRGPFLGRVFWDGAAESDTGIPDKVGDFEKERVLRAPANGRITAFARIGDLLEAEDQIADVDGVIIRAPFRGVLRGIIHEGLEVTKGLKIGDLDPRCDPLLCSLVSDKALAVGGGVLEAILSRDELRMHLND